MTDEQRLDPVETFRRYKARREAIAEASSYKWTPEEIRELEQAGETDNDRARELVALWPLIEQSHSRGDWKRPNEMTRAEAAEWLQSQGRVGEPWSLLEVRMIQTNDELREKYGDELKQIQAEGRLIVGPPEETRKGRIWPFAGEAPEVAEKELHRKLRAIDKRRAADKALEAAMTELSTDPDSRIGSNATRAYLRDQLDQAWAHGNSKEFPVTQRPHYKTVLSEYERRGGKL